MRRAWAALLAVWSTLAIVAALAWSHPPAPTATQATPVTIVVQGRNGKRHLARVFLLPAGSAAHASTHSSRATAPAPTLVPSTSIFVSRSPTAPHVATGPS
jgi:hypothetical protein